MSAKNILFLGFGDIAARTSALLPQVRSIGVARSVKKMPADIEFWQGAADAPATLSRMAERPLAAVILTLTPADYSDLAYKVAYVETVSNLIQHWQKTSAPELIVFVSSTSVYAQNDGQWVNESSVTQPDGFAGQRILEAENLLNKSGLPVCIVRFGGIYGPGRDFLLRQVRAGKGGNSDFSNRIHAKDCAGVLALIVQRTLEQQPIGRLYLACDDAPSRSNEVRTWLAQKMGMNPSILVPSESKRGGNKRCSNRLLRALGYQFRYPTFREGYSALMDGSDTSV